MYISTYISIADRRPNPPPRWCRRLGDRGATAYKTLVVRLWSQRGHCLQDISSKTVVTEAPLPTRHS